MAIVTQGGEGSESMADRPDDLRDQPEAEEPDRDEPQEMDQDEEREERAPVAPTVSVAPKIGFFHVYKSGQGYWTRLGTVVGIGLLILLIANFLYTQLETRTALDMVKNAAGNVVATPFPMWKAIIVGVWIIGSCLLAWKYLNSPTVVDFLIATESEMKKVNWTSRKELFGSTKVVIVFMFLIAAILFLVDVAFGGFFYWINVLKTGPFG